MCYKVLPPVSCKQHSLVTEFLPLAKKLHLALGQEFSATQAVNAGVLHRNVTNIDGACYILS